MCRSRPGRAGSTADRSKPVGSVSGRGAEHETASGRFSSVSSRSPSGAGVNALTEFVGAIFILPNVIAAVLIFWSGRRGRRTLPTGSWATRRPGRSSPRAPITDDRDVHDPRAAEDRSRHRCDDLHVAARCGASLALAFGLGGRDVAARMLEGAYQKGQQNKEQIKQDFAQGKSKPGGRHSRRRTRWSGPWNSPRSAARGDGCRHRHDPGPIVIAEGRLRPPSPLYPPP